MTTVLALGDQDPGDLADRGGLAGTVDPDDEHHGGSGTVGTPRPGTGPSVGSTRVSSSSRSTVRASAAPAPSTRSRVRSRSTSSVVGPTPTSAVIRVSSMSSQVSSSSRSRESSASRPRPSAPCEPASRCRSRTSRLAVPSGRSTAARSPSRRLPDRGRLDRRLRSTGASSTGAAPVPAGGACSVRGPARRAAGGDQADHECDREDRDDGRSAGRARVLTTGPSNQRPYPGRRWSTAWCARAVRDPRLGRSRSPPTRVDAALHRLAQPRSAGHLLATVREGDVHDDSGRGQQDHQHHQRRSQHRGRPSREHRLRVHCPLTAIVVDGPKRPDPVPGSGTVAGLDQRLDDRADRLGDRGRAPLLGGRRAALPGRGRHVDVDEAALPRPRPRPGPGRSRRGRPPSWCRPARRPAPGRSARGSRPRGSTGRTPRPPRPPPAGCGCRPPSPRPGARSRRCRSARSSARCSCGRTRRRRPTASWPGATPGSPTWSAGPAQALSASRSR